MNYTIQDYINNFIYLKKKCKIINRRNYIIYNYGFYNKKRI